MLTIESKPFFLMKNNFTQFNFNNKYFIFILEYNFFNSILYIYLYYTETLYNVFILMQHRIFYLLCKSCKAVNERLLEIM